MVAETPDVLPEALAAVLALLRCPHCGRPLAPDGRAVRCASGHAFDVARQGYLSLLAGGRAPAGDTAAMVAARERVLGGGLFDPLSAAIAGAAAGGAGGALVEVGAGTAHHLARALDRAPQGRGIALDVSRPALRRAARAHPRAAAVGADVWGPLPLRDGVAGAALCVFAPRNGPELHRVLAPGGVLVVATPEPEHLAELRAALGLLDVDPRKEERLSRRLGDAFARRASERVAWSMRLDRDGQVALAAMGPSAFHADAAELERRAAALPAELEVTGAVTVAVYERR